MTPPPLHQMHARYLNELLFSPLRSLNLPLEPNIPLPPSHSQHIYTLDSCRSQKVFVLETENLPNKHIRYKDTFSQLSFGQY